MATLGRGVQLKQNHQNRFMRGETWQYIVHPMDLGVHRFRQTLDVDFTDCWLTQVGHLQTRIEM